MNECTWVLGRKNRIFRKRKWMGKFARIQENHWKMFVFISIQMNKHYSISLLACVCVRMDSHYFYYFFKLKKSRFFDFENHICIDVCVHTCLIIIIFVLFNFLATSPKINEIMEAFTFLFSGFINTSSWLATCTYWKQWIPSSLWLKWDDDHKILCLFPHLLFNDHKM